MTAVLSVEAVDLRPVRKKWSESDEVDTCSGIPTSFVENNLVASVSEARLIQLRAVRRC